LGRAGNAGTVEWLLWQGAQRLTMIANGAHLQ
jgi:hypothetical protein